jgi:phage/plasmid-associated DNA primase
MPTARLILATNNLPRFTDKTSGIWRRMLLMPFRVVVPEADRVHGMDKPEWWHQQGELPGILNWAIDGLRRLRQNGRFTTSNLCNRELAAYRVDCNPAALFLAETCAAMPSADVVTADVYARYSTWCDQNGYRRLAANSFGREIQRAFPQAEQGKVWNREGRRTEGYKGIALRDEIGNGEDAANAISDF